MSASGNNRALNKLDKLIKEFRRIDTEMPMQTALAFIYIANNDGKINFALPQIL